MKRLILFLAAACGAWAQVATVPNTDFPTFRSNLNVSLGNAASITGNYSNPSWIASLAYAKITGVPSFLTTVPAPGSSTLGGVFSGQCTTTTGKLMGYDTSGNRICESDQTTGGGSGITSLNGLIGATQTFGNDTNVTMVSSGTAHTLTWSGALAKARQHAATVYTDQANTYSAGFKQSFRSSSTVPMWNLGTLTADPTSGTSDFWYRSDTFLLSYNWSGIIGRLPYVVDAGTLPPTGRCSQWLANGEISYASAACGSVTSVTSANADIGVASTTSAPVLTLNSGAGANQIVKLNGSSQLPAVSAALLTNFPTLNQSTTGNAATATALAANGTNCSAGSYPLGVDASGNAEGCTVAGGGSSTAAYISSLFAGPDTTRTITGATHGYTSAALLVAVYDNASPRNRMEATYSVNSSTFDVVITFASATSNYYVVVNGGTGPAGAAGAAGQGVPTGGTAGQSLVKIDSTNYNTQWSTVTGSGTVTTTGTMTTSALVTSNSGTVIKTPSATATLDSSGNISTPGTVSTGVGGSVGGVMAVGAGTASVAATGFVGFMAPTTVTTPFNMTLPAAPTTGFLLNTGTTDPSAISIVASNGSGNVLRSAGTATIASGKTLTVNNTLTVTATDGITMTTPSTSFTAARIDAGQTFTGTQVLTATLGSTSTGTTQSAHDNSTKIATTAYVDAAGGGAALVSASGQAMIPGTPGFGLSQYSQDNPSSPSQAVANSVALLHFYAAGSFNVDQLGLYTTTPGSAGCKAGFGLYDDTKTKILSVTLTDATTIKCTDSGSLVLTGATSPAVTGFTTFPAGWYWLATTSNESTMRVIGTWASSGAGTTGFLNAGSHQLGILSGAQASTNGVLPSSFTFGSGYLDGSVSVISNFILSKL